MEWSYSKENQIYRQMTMVKIKGVLNARKMNVLAQAQGHVQVT